MRTEALRTRGEPTLVRGARPPRWAALGLGLLLLALPVAAEEWHEAYRAGVQALARGDAQRAVQALRRAIASRPEPGRNVVTYGTNIEPRYFPYLRLAEAHLALGQTEAAAEVLKVSAAKGAEPADERQKLQARLESAIEAQRPPPPATPAPSAPLPAPAPSSPAPSPEPTPEATPVPPVPTTAVAPTTLRARSPSPPTTPRPTPPPTPAAVVVPRPAPPRDTGSIEIVSHPPGALAYLDDEPLGPTDPQSGRLVKSSLEARRYRVRVALAGHEDFLREIDVNAEGRVSVYATLNARGRSNGMGAGWVAFGVVAISLTAAVAWMVLRRPATPAPLWSATPRPRSGGVGTPATPSGGVNPGVRRDEQGLEWFGEYHLLEMLGRGGMASVYKAERAGEISALKRPLGALLEDKEFLERFLREAEIGRTLNHPNIVRILSRGHVEGVPYFTMELLPGQTLQAYLASWGAAEPRTAVTIVAQVAEALDFAHSKGVIHRDLKPSNIMLLNDGTTKVMDFGIARARRFEGLTATGAFLGTPDYVAPEVIEGGVAEPRSDLYSLGAVFYELLTGRRPFSGETAFSVLQKHVGEEAPLPSRLQPGVSPELDALVRRLLAKTAEERPASTEELVVALRDWLNRVA